MLSKHHYALKIRAVEYSRPVSEQKKIFEFIQRFFDKNENFIVSRRWARRKRLIGKGTSLMTPGQMIKVVG